MIIVSFWPILAAAVAAVVIGFIWYGPLFGKPWMSLSGATLSPKKMILSTVVGLIGAMLIAYVMSYFGIAWAVSDWIGALELGFWSWIGFVFPTMYAQVNWEGQPFKLFAIHAGYWLVAFIAMALALVYISPYFTPSVVDQYAQGGMNTPSNLINSTTE